MRAVVTGSAGHLGEALMRTLRGAGTDVVGVDIKPSGFTDIVGSVSDRECVRRCMADVNVVYHTATLHKPHVATHSMQQFVDTNISGTLALLEESVRRGVRAFVFTSTTSTFGDSLRPPPGTPAAWITENVLPVPKNIYGSTKTAAEDLCHLIHRKDGLNCVVLRTSRFFPEEDDDADKRAAFSGDNAKANEFLYRRVELEDVVSAHLCAGRRATDVGFGRYIISATTPLRREDVDELNRDAPAVVHRRVPEYAAVYARLGWKMFPTIDRVYDNSAARRDLGWTPRYDFDYVLRRLGNGALPRSALAVAVGSKGYHDRTFDDGPFPV